MGTDAALAHPAPGHGGNQAIPFTSAAVSSDGTELLQVSWTPLGVRDVAVYQGTSAAGACHLAGFGGGQGSLVVSASGGDWFRLVPRCGASLTVTERGLGLASNPNLRDIGGYRTTDGQWVTMGVVYLSQARTCWRGPRRGRHPRHHRRLRPADARGDRRGARRCPRPGRHT